MHSDDVGVVEGGHDLNLPPDVDKVLLILDFVFPDGFDGHLWMRTEWAVNSQREKFPPPLPNLGRGSQTRSQPPSFPTCRTRELSSAAPWKQLPEKSEFYRFGVYPSQSLLLHAREKLPPRDTGASSSFLGAPRASSRR